MEWGREYWDIFLIAVVVVIVFGVMQAWAWLTEHHRSGQVDFRFALPRNHRSPRRLPPGPSSLLDRAKVLGARFVGCSRGWRSGRNAVPHPI